MSRKNTGKNGGKTGKSDLGLNLPQTSFPMRAGLPKLEPRILAQWWQSDAFKRHLHSALAERSETFVLHDGPPYANGDIHTGHAINKVLKDIIVKSHWLNGEGGLYVPGWDCHGLPIEHKVEGQLGKAGREVGRAEFRRACRDYAMEQVQVQMRGFIRLGVQGEWGEPYLTAKPKYEADMLRALAQMVRRGHLKRGQKPVHWCTQCQSALAEAEVEYEEHESTAVDVAFVAADGALAEAVGLAADSEVAIVAWTTTPWTLPANQALCVHPELQYVALRPKGGAGGEGRWYLLASGLAERVAERCGWGDCERGGEVAGSDLAGVQVVHPFQQRRVPVIAADHVTLEVGTGVVHTAPAHGLDDWRVGNEHGLDRQQLVGPDGSYSEAVPDLAGVEIRAAEERIVEMMRRSGTLLLAEPYRHSYPHCWRHHKPVIFRATPQWFIGMQEAGLLPEALRAAREDVRFFPDSGRERFVSMLEGRPDWCISRQRVWGVPLALFQHRDSGEAHPRTAELLEQVADRMELGGLDVWDELDAGELLPAEEVAQYDKCPDVLDVWFDSGASHYCVLSADDRLRAPADMYLEGTDQHRGWFQSSMLTSVAMGRGAPYKSLLTHGFLVDDRGNKMSKSRGNGLLPDEIWDKWGADILRLWIASADYRGEMVLSESILASVADIYRRIRNTLRFLLGNLHDFDMDACGLSPTDLLDIDRWALERAAQVQEELRGEYGRYRLHAVCRVLHDFCAADLGAFYLDVLKDRLYTCKTDGLPRRSAQYVLWHLAQALVRWMAPILSFSAEEAWYHLNSGGAAAVGSGSVAVGAAETDAVFAPESSVLSLTWHEFPQAADGHLRDDRQVDWAAVRWVRETVNLHLEQARKDKLIGSSLAAEVVISDVAATAALAPLGAEAHFALLVSGVHLAPDERSAVREEDEAVQVRPAPGRKCDRCWHFIADVPAVAGDDDGDADGDAGFVCGRCQLNLSVGEERRFV